MCTLFCYECKLRQEYPACQKFTPTLNREELDWRQKTWIGEMIWDVRISAALAAVKMMSAVGGMGFGICVGYLEE